MVRRCPRCNKRYRYVDDDEWEVPVIDWVCHDCWRKVNPPRDRREIPVDDAGKSIEERGR